jgi:N-formylglutamate amidohydrolase
MTVGELIAVLREMPQELPVLVSSQDTGYTEHFEVALELAAEDEAYASEDWWAGRYQPLSDSISPRKAFDAVLVTRGKAR